MVLNSLRLKNSKKYLVSQFLILTILLAGFSTVIVSQIIHKDTSDSDIEKIVSDAQAKVVPVENSDSVLGVKFNIDGYDRLVNDSEIALSW